MNDLISREALINIFQKKADENTGLIRNNMLFAKKIVEDKPTTYDIDKVVEQLDEIASNVADHEREYISEEEVYNLLLYFIEIVKGGGLE